MVFVYRLRIMDAGRKGRVWRTDVGWACKDQRINGTEIWGSCKAGSGA